MLPPDIGKAFAESLNLFLRLLILDSLLSSSSSFSSCYCLPRLIKLSANKNSSRCFNQCFGTCHKQCNKILWRKFFAWEKVVGEGGKQAVDESRAVKAAAAFTSIPIPRAIDRNNIHYEFWLENNKHIRCIFVDYGERCTECGTVLCFRVENLFRIHFFDIKRYCNRGCWFVIYLMSEALVQFLFDSCNNWEFSSAASATEIFERQVKDGNST